MAKVGSPSTNRYMIGTAELRVGPLSSANKLTQAAHSVGAIDSANVEITQNSVDLMGGFPQNILDTAVVSQEASITATLREYSKRNLAVMLGEAVGTYSADVVSLVTTNVVAGGVTLDVTAGDGGNFPVGTIVSIYRESNPEEVTIARVASVAVDSVTFDADTPMLFDYNGTTEVVRIFAAQATAVGAITSTNYFSVMLLQLNREHGRPVIWNFWKGAIGAGLTYGTDATDFSSTELNIKLLQPAAVEYATGADLYHLRSIIPSYPTGMFIAGGDL